MSFVKEVQSTEVAEDVAYLQSSGAGAFLEELAAAVVAEKPEDPLEGLICIAQRIKERAPVVQFVPHSPAPPPPRQDSRQSQGSTEKEPPADTTSRQRESVISVQSEESCSVFGSTDLAAQRKVCFLFCEHLYLELPKYVTEIFFFPVNHSHRNTPGVR